MKEEKEKLKQEIKEMKEERENFKLEMMKMKEVIEQEIREKLIKEIRENHFNE
ncbi:hypothetical protein BCR32DRAFT_282345 [Anaeromyces robustus]|uniref:Uncharacterized protein n=1 Tax=Anaeromyces robustus TaxID=1754192 RepID=A0A1Y1WXT9_9FUNG|nr:hypothetical protein BCR32DRAFT_282345 [Anaeromyces robustus]|eukprot:ORX78361.1 hypothetical protein BCR32DRAFT_282345 [Anaeromyces robustus]